MRPDQIFSLGVLLILFGLLALTLSRLEIPVRVPDQPSETPPIAVERPREETSENRASDLYVVNRVVDGDTIDVRSLGLIRLIGIDTPELDDARGQHQCLAVAAAQRMEEILVDRQVKLTRDVEGRDRYRRFLRYIYLPDGTFVNEELVREGYAKILTIPPNVRYAPVFLLAQQEARLAQRGLWDPNTCR